MLHDLIAENRVQIIERAQRLMRDKSIVPSVGVALAEQIALFLMQVVAALKRDFAGIPLDPASVTDASEQIADGGARYGNDLHRGGLTVAQVVHCYGDVCQIVTELAGDTATSISAGEFHVFNRCLDEAIAGAVTEYNRLHERHMAHEDAERLGFFAHELRNGLSTAILSFDAIQRGMVGVGGSTGAIHVRSLSRLRALVERSLATVRLEAGSPRLELVPLGEFMADMESSAALEARSRGVDLKVETPRADVVFHADRELLASAVSNLVQNACKFTRPGGHVSCAVRVTHDRIMIDVADQCGGLPPGKVDELFRPFSRKGADHSGLGLGLSIARSAVEVHAGAIHVRDVPGVGCVFTVDIPRLSTPTEVPSGEKPVANRGPRDWPPKLRPASDFAPS